MPAEKHKFKNVNCNDKMTFEECELAILRDAVDKNENDIKQLKEDKQIYGEELDIIFDILENFIVRKKLVLYGGFAINAVLPKFAQFYNRAHDIPDYDCYSPTPMEDAIELANLYYKKGYTEVEAKAGVHFGTYKVYVNFIGIADISHLEKSIFTNLQKDAVVINDIHYCPINFLRRNIYWELSQPQGDISRWEKIFKRLNILNTYYPFTVNHNCNEVDFQRKMDSNNENSEVIYNIVRNAFIFMGAVFFGGYACSLYSQHMPPDARKIIRKIPDFDVLFEDINMASKIVKEKLNEGGFNNVVLIKHENIGEIIPAHYEVKVGDEIIAFIYEPIACHSYNVITVKTEKINVATIETILYLYFSFYYSNQPYYFRDRIICMAKILFDVEQENRMNQRGILKRFVFSCVGKQNTLDEIRKKKTEKFKELYGKRGTREYMLWFLKYNPAFDKFKHDFKRKNKNTRKRETGKKYTQKSYANVVAIGKKKNRTYNYRRNRKNAESKSQNNVFQW